MVHQPAAARSGTIDRLGRSLADVLYAASIAPDTYHYRSPADPAGLEWLGTWSIAENLAHLAIYEEQVAAPILEAIVAGRDASADVNSVIESDYEVLGTLCQSRLWAKSPSGFRTPDRAKLMPFRR